MTIIIVLIIAAVIILYAVSIQRQLVSCDEMCQNAMSQIGVQQNSRWDALTSLADLVKSYNEHEYNTLRDIIAQRKQVTGTSSSEDANVQETAISNALKQLNVVVENYPELKAEQNYGKLMTSLNDYENKVRLSRMTYNDTVTKLNRKVRQFPDSIFAGIFGFQTRTYLQEPQGKTDMPSMKI